VVYRFDEFTLDADRVEVRRGRAALALEPKAFRVLVYLIQNRERAVTKEELIEKVWAGAFVGDNALTRVIAQIRKQLGDSAREPRYIETLATTGYRFVAAVSDDAARSEFPSRRRKPVWILAAVAVLIVAGIAVWVVTSGRQAVPRFTGLHQLTTSVGADRWPSFSPDGSQLVYSSNSSGSFQLYVRSLAPGSSPRQITNGSNNYLQPAWSPGGHYIAFVMRPAGGIGIVPSSGGYPRLLTQTGDSPHWSWDSKTLVYRVLRQNIDPSLETTGLIDNALMLADVATGESRPLTQPDHPPGGHTQPFWMRDGRHLLFTVYRGSGTNEPWKIDSRTGTASRLGISETNVSNMILGPDSRTLYFIGKGDGIWRATLEGDRILHPEVLIPASGTASRDLALSADGRRLAVAQQIGSNSVWSVTLDGNGSPLGPPKAIVQDRSMRHADVLFSADGSKISYMTSRVGGDLAIYVANADGSSAEPLSLGEDDARTPIWFGRELAVAYRVLKSGKQRFWVQPLDGSKRPLDLKFDLPNTDRVRISRDGKLIAGHVVTPAGFQVVVQDLPAGAMRRVTPPERNIGFAIPSPDGRWIAAGERLEGKQKMVILPAAGGEIRAIPIEMDQVFTHDWAPDGDRLSFAGLKDGVWNVYWISLRTGKIQQLTHFDAKQAFVRYPAWSPKGDQIVFERNDLVSNIYVGELK
jgi:Tol biopolymer transport system component/DNA-binding winged helix-turn-helix (wHTH) protein